MSSFKYEIPIRGRLPRVKFPIEGDVIERGTEYHKTINENEPADCIHCGKQFLINQDVAYYIRNPMDRGPYIRCPNCGFKCAAFHYYDRVKRPRPKIKIMTPEVRIIPWDTPEG